MPHFQTVAKVGDIPEGEGRSFIVESRPVAVFLRNGEYFAISDVCPHMGAPLAGGELEGENVICPWHAWRFCLRDGTWMDNPKSKLRNPCYPVRVVGTDVQVGVDSSE